MTGLHVRPADAHPHLARLGAVGAWAGALMLLVGTVLHPMDADPAIPREAFAEYARDPIWVASHLAQFLGVAGLGAAFIALASLMETGRARAWGRISAFGAAASVAAAAVLQAVDGVALKVMVDHWAAATGEAQARAFEAALAVRQIEIGLASLLALLFGLTILALAAGMLFSERFGKWLAWLGLVGGAGTFMSGIAQAYSGFSPIAMILSMSASSIVLFWTASLGIAMWRLAPRLEARVVA